MDSLTSLHEQQQLFLNEKNFNNFLPPIKFTSSEKIKLILQQHKLENKQLQSQIDKMKSALENCSQKVNPEINNDLITPFSGTDQQKIPPFMKLFWGGGGGGVGESSRDI